LVGGVDDSPAVKGPGCGERLALVEQLPDPGGEGQLAAGVAAPPARGPLRPHGGGGIQRAQERLLHPEHLGGPPTSYALAGRRWARR